MNLKRKKLKSNKNTTRKAIPSLVNICIKKKRKIKDIKKNSKNSNRLESKVKRFSAYKINMKQIKR